jgi:hypothetical protein
MAVVGIMMTILDSVVFTLNAQASAVLMNNTPSIIETL